MTRIISTWRNQAELIEMLRARVVELGTTFAKLDAFTGLPDGYSSKVLGPRPTKQLGRMSLETLLSALAVKGGLIEDPEQLEMVNRRLPKRKAGPTQATSTITLHLSRLHLRKIGKKGKGAKKKRGGKRLYRRLGRMGGRARMEAMTPEQRSAFARRAVMKRWDRDNAIAPS